MSFLIHYSNFCLFVERRLLTFDLWSSFPLCIATWYSETCSSNALIFFCNVSSLAVLTASDFGVQICLNKEEINKALTNYKSNFFLITNNIFLIDCKNKSTFWLILIKFAVLPTIFSSSTSVFWNIFNKLNIVFVICAYMSSLCENKGRTFQETP